MKAFTKSLLNSSRHSMYVVVNTRIWFASSTLLNELYNSSNPDVSATISRYIAPNSLMLADKHDPNNVTKFTNPKLISALPSELQCATLLPVQAWNDKTIYFNQCRLIDACHDFAVVTPSILYTFDCTVRFKNWHTINSQRMQLVSLSCHWPVLESNNLKLWC